VLCPIYKLATTFIIIKWQNKIIFNISVRRRLLMEASSKKEKEILERYHRKRRGRRFLSSNLISLRGMKHFTIRKIFSWPFPLGHARR